MKIGDLLNAQQDAPKRTKTQSIRQMFVNRVYPGIIDNGAIDLEQTDRSEKGRRLLRISGPVTTPPVSPFLHWYRMHPADYEADLENFLTLIFFPP